MRYLIHSKEGVLNAFGGLLRDQETCARLAQALGLPEGIRVLSMNAPVESPTVVLEIEGDGIPEGEGFLRARYVEGRFVGWTELRGDRFVDLDYHSCL